MSLTDAAIRNAKSREKAYKMYDSDGLFVIVTPKGGKWWRVKYTMQGKERLLSLGTYPKIGLAEARKRRDEVKSSVANGQDPSAQRKEAKAVAVETARHQEATFEAVAREWFAIASPDLTPKYAAKMMGYLERVFFPAIGGKLVADLLPVDILNIGHKEQRAGRIYTAHKLTYLAGQVLQYAFIKGLVTVNVARGITGALQPFHATNFSAITDPKAIGKLLRDIDDYAGYPSIVYYLKILPYVFTRPGELRLAAWADVDFENAVLTIPWQRLKTRKMSQKDHKVPLASQVVTLLQELHRFSGSGKFLFPSARAKTDTISDAGPLNALRDMGYPKDMMTLHGFRSMASTRLNEMGFRSDIIEAQLAHKDKDAIRAVYNRSEYFAERKAMMQSWATYLDKLRADVLVIQ